MFVLHVLCKIVINVLMMYVQFVVVQDFWIFQELPQLVLLVDLLEIWQIAPNVKVQMSVLNVQQLIL